MVPSDLTPVRVTVSPSAAPARDIAGVGSAVTLSVFDEPVSLGGKRSGATAAVGGTLSIVMSRPGPDGEVFPAGSVTVDDMVHLPSVMIGRSQLPTVGEAM